MATPVTYTVGPSKDYADPGAFVADIDVGIGNPVDNDEVWTVDSFKQTGSAAYLFSNGESFNGLAFATDCDATRYAVITTAAGESWVDNYSEDDPLKLVTANGVTIQVDNNGVGIDLNDPSCIFCRTSKIQVLVQGTFARFGYGVYFCDDAGQTAIVAADQILIENNATGHANNRALFAGLGDPQFQNVILIDNRAGADGALLVQSFRASVFRNFTIVKSSDVSPDAGSIGIRCGDTSNMQNKFYSTAVFNFGSDVNNPASGISGDYNASDSTGMPGSNSLDNVTYGDVFENNDKDSQDWRLKSGSPLIDAGDPSNSTAEDIIGTTRDDPDIGVWEFVAAAAVKPFEGFVNRNIGRLIN